MKEAKLQLFQRDQTIVEHLIGRDFQETCTEQILTLPFLSAFLVNTIFEKNIKTIDIFPGKDFNISFALDSLQQEQLVHILHKHSNAFSWDYTDMKGIHPNTCIHHIYTKENVKPVRKPRRRMNPTLKEVVKTELKKLLNVNLIYPILNSQWVSPLVDLPKKTENGVCV